MNRAFVRRIALVVARDRALRRLLFDLFDAQDFETVHTAHDAVQARAALEREERVDIVVLEFPSDSTDAVALATELAAGNRSWRPPIIGIRPMRAASAPGSRPLDAVPGVVAWIDSPVDPGEFLQRVSAALADGTVRAGGASPGAANFRLAFDASLDELLLVDAESQRVVEVNPAFLAHTGYTRAQVIGGRVETFDVTLDSPARDAHRSEVASTGQARWQGMKARADGGTYRVDVAVRSGVHRSRAVHLYAFRDLGELGRYRKTLEVVARAAASGADSEGYEAVLRSISDWLSLDFALIVRQFDGQDPEPRPIATVQVFAVTAETPDPLRQSTLRRVLGGEEVVVKERAWRDMTDDAFVRERRFQTLIALPLPDERGSPLGALLLARRESLPAPDPALDGLRIIAQRLGLELELQRVREQGRAHGLHDALTGLPNRLLFHDRLSSTIDSAHRTGEMFAIAFVDLDHFKQVNELHGHAAGDLVLAALAARLRSSVRASDTVARYAGDEFTLVLRHIIQRDDVQRLAAKIVQMLAAPIPVPGVADLAVTVSVGLAFYPEDGTDPDALLRHADQAMYAAKGRGRNTFQSYVAVPEETRRQRTALESGLRKAVANNELRVYYQPQVDTQSEDIIGVEALVRWEHPEFGMISPGFFVPLAEENGLIVPIGEWLLRTACGDVCRWQSRFRLPLRLSLNLSALQLRRPDLAVTVSGILAETGLDPRHLDLELTESLSVKSIPNLLTTIESLRALGCQISIDDFGTGQASLDYIKRFPADRIKIDQTFVRNIGIDPGDEAIVEATVMMAHNLHHDVVAEGVETERHLEFLRELECEALQGFLFCRPLPASALEHLLLERERLVEPLPGEPQGA